MFYRPDPDPRPLPPADPFPAPNALSYESWRGTTWEPDHGRTRPAADPRGSFHGPGHANGPWPRPDGPVA